MNGYIVWPKDMDDTFAWYTVPKTAWLYQHLVTRACFKDSMFKTVKIPVGSLATSIKRLATETGLTDSEVRTALSNLEQSGDITKRSVGHMTVISVTDYAKYRANELRNSTPKSSTSLAIGSQHMNNKDLKDNNYINNIISAWNDAGFKAIKKVGAGTEMHKDLCALIDDYGEDGVLQGIEKAKQSDFLRSQNWFTLGWFVKPDNFAKVYNGNYDNRDTPAQAAPEKPREMTAEEVFQSNQDYTERLMKGLI